MFIKRVTIENYRNIDACSIEFSRPSTYVLGENNLGKTNLLKLLRSVFNQSMLDENDFADQHSRVSVLTELILEEYEVGVFNDIADSSNHLQITIEGVVDEPESEFKFFHKETGEEISGSLVRRICFFLI